MVGHTLHSSTGSWSLDAVTLSYQWYAGSQEIAGATSAAYQPTPAEAGQALHVVVTATSPGYIHRTAESTATTPVLLGHATVAKPTVSGKALLGAALRAHLAEMAPTSATAHYQWLRGHEPIRGAHDSTYVVRSADVGRRIHVQVTVAAKNWVSVSRRSLASAHVQTVPVLHMRTRIRHGRVFLSLRVVSPGLAHTPVGTARVWRHQQRVGHCGSSMDVAADGSHTCAPAPTPSPWSTTAARWRRSAGSPCRSPSPDASEDLEPDPGRLEPTGQRVTHRLGRGDLAGRRRVVVEGQA